jgi:hypothetical protein
MGALLKNLIGEAKSGAKYKEMGSLVQPSAHLFKGDGPSVAFFFGVGGHHVWGLLAPNAQGLFKALGSFNRSQSRFPLGVHAGTGARAPMIKNPLYKHQLLALRMNNKIIIHPINATSTGDVMNVKVGNVRRYRRTYAIEDRIVNEAQC